MSITKNTFQQLSVAATPLFPESLSQAIEDIKRAAEKRVADNEYVFYPVSVLSEQKTINGGTKNIAPIEHDTLITIMQEYGITSIGEFTRISMPELQKHLSDEEIQIIQEQLHYYGIIIGSCESHERAK